MKSSQFKTLAFWLVLGGIAFASLKVWSTGEIIRSTDLNSNFSTLNTTKVGGGVQATNSDISSSAAISHTKLATPALVPKAWAYVVATCSSDPCTVAVSSGITTINRSGAGVYVAHLNSARADSYFAPFATPQDSGGIYCVVGVTSTSAVTIRCFGGGGTTPTDTAFSLMILDNL